MHTNDQKLCLNYLARWISSSKSLKVQFTVHHEKRDARCRHSEMHIHEIDSRMCMLLVWLCYVRSCLHLKRSPCLKKLIIFVHGAKQTPVERDGVVPLGFLSALAICDEHLTHRVTFAQLHLIHLGSRHDELHQHMWVDFIQLHSWLWSFAVEVSLGPPHLRRSLPPIYYTTCELFSLSIQILVQSQKLAHFPHAYQLCVLLVLSWQLNFPWVYGHRAALPE